MRSGHAALGLALAGAVTAAAQEPLILQREERWGPCATNHICRQTTELYATGRLVKTGQVNSKSQVGPMAVERVLGAIRRSGILRKECPVQAGHADAFIQYSFNVDGVSRIVKAPGCAAELQMIAEALEPPVKPREIPEPVRQREDEDPYGQADDDPFFR